MSQDLQGPPDRPVPLVLAAHPNRHLGHKVCQWKMRHVSECVALVDWPSPSQGTISHHQRCWPRIVFANRDLAIEAWAKGMLGATLRYYEVRDEKAFFKDIPNLRVPKDMVQLAGHILDRKAGHFDAGKFKDEYELALRKLVKRKAAGHTIERPVEEAPPTNVINLMDALRQSMN